MAIGEEAVIQAAAAKLRAVREKNAAPPVAVAPPAAAPVETPPAPASEAPKGPERAEDGKFKKREMSDAEKGLLSAARAEREKRKAVEASLSDLKKQIEELKNARPSTTPDKRAELLKKAPEETQKFWGDIADPVVRQTVDEEIEKRLAAYRPALEAYAAQKASEGKASAFRDELVEFAEEMALEGIEFDPVALVNKINFFETEHGIILGSTNRMKFKNALNMLADAGAARQSPEVEAAAKAKQEQEAKARAGGVSPSTTVTPPAPDSRATLQNKVHDLAKSGDYRSIGNLIKDRLQHRPAYSHPLQR
jgi:hypothetical protein